MHQAQPYAQRPVRTAAGALMAALLAIGVLPAIASAAGLTVPSAVRAPTVPKAVGSGAPSGAPTPAPSPSPSPSPGPSSDPGGSSTDNPGSVSSDRFDRPGDFGIPGFSFPRPDKPPSGSPDCGPGCEEQWTNYLMVAAQAADKWANEITDPAVAKEVGDLADRLWSEATAADERLNGPISDARPGSASPDASSAPVVDQAGQQDDEDVPPDAMPLGWLVGESDLSGTLIEGAMRLIQGLPGIFGPDGTTLCSNGAKPDGTLAICTK